MESIDTVFRTRSLGIAASGLPDQYADGKAAKVWKLYIGNSDKRTSQYKHWLVDTLKEHNCHTVLDAACGTGVDSILLLQDGFQVTSCDASDKMLKYALKERWDRRKEKAFDSWVIEEANWLSLDEDLSQVKDIPKSWDAVLCLGNSFANLPDFDDKQSSHIQALTNFAKLVSPGGILIVDHRNYDQILKLGSIPARNIYYNSDVHVNIRVSNLFVNCVPKLVTLDYMFDLSELGDNHELMTNPLNRKLKEEKQSTFRLSNYPHQLESFKKLIEVAFGDSLDEHWLLGDFKPYDKDSPDPTYFIHVIKKK